MKKIFYLISIFLTICSLHVSAKDSVTVIKIYPKKLPTYNAEGKHIAFINAGDIPEGSLVKKYNDKSGLVLIGTKTKDVWLGISALKFSGPLKGPCPTSYASAAADLTSPASSGLGGLCDD
ncbi:MAG: hypothetical protein GQ582_13215 [Methyloprofundus sp.]|nr:hypothetical protein [Methyloprofundus sp.]